MLFWQDRWPPQQCCIERFVGSTVAASAAAPSTRILTTAIPSTAVPSMETPIPAAQRYRISAGPSRIGSATKRGAEREQGCRVSGLQVPHGGSEDARAQHGHTKVCRHTQADKLTHIRAHTHARAHSYTHSHTLTEALLQANTCICTLTHAHLLTHPGAQRCLLGTGVLQLAEIARLGPTDIAGCVLLRHIFIFSCQPTDRCRD
jgi:hypothetical protein